jgi:antirestriction protein ArdC
VHSTPSVDHEKFLKIIHDYCDREKIQVDYAGLRAYYRPKDDTIQVPRRENFESIEDFLFTLSHEIAHSTGHRDRLARFQTSTEMEESRKELYAFEEIVADMTACLLLSESGITPDMANSASYVE